MSTPPTITPMTPLDELPQFLTPAEVCAFLRLGRATVYDLIRRGELAHARFGRLVRVPRAALRSLASGEP